MICNKDITNIKGAGTIRRRQQQEGLDAKRSQKSTTSVRMRSARLQFAIEHKAIENRYYSQTDHKQNLNHADGRQNVRWKIC